MPKAKKHVVGAYFGGPFDGKEERLPDEVLEGEYFLVEHKLWIGDKEASTVLHAYKLDSIGERQVGRAKDSRSATVYYVLLCHIGVDSVSTQERL